MEENGKQFFSDDTMVLVREISSINAENGVPQEAYVAEEASEFIKEWTKILRHKGDTMRLLDEAMDMYSALTVLFDRYCISHSAVERHMCDKIQTALAKNKKTGEV